MDSSLHGLEHRGCHFVAEPGVPGPVLQKALAARRQQEVRLHKKSEARPDLRGQKREDGCSRNRLASAVASNPERNHDLASPDAFALLFSQTGWNGDLAAVGPPQGAGCTVIQANQAFGQIVAYEPHQPVAAVIL